MGTRDVKELSHPEALQVLKQLATGSAETKQAVFDAVHTILPTRRQPPPRVQKLKGKYLSKGLGWVGKARRWWPRSGRDGTPPMGSTTGGVQMAALGSGATALHVPLMLLAVLLFVSMLLWCLCCRRNWGASRRRISRVNNMGGLAGRVVKAGLQPVCFEGTSLHVRSATWDRTAKKAAWKFEESMRFQLLPLTRVRSQEGAHLFDGIAFHPATAKDLEFRTLRCPKPFDRVYALTVGSFSLSFHFFFLGCFCALRKNLVFFTVHFTLFDEKSPDYSQNLDGPLFSLTLLSSFFQKTRERRGLLGGARSWRTTPLTSARMRMSAARRG